MLAYLAKVHAEVWREPGKVFARMAINLTVFFFFYWLLPVVGVGPDGAQLLLYFIGTIVGSTTATLRVGRTST